MGTDSRTPGNELARGNSTSSVHDPDFGVFLGAAVNN